MKERTDPKAISQTMKRHYDEVWQGGDSWSFETSEYEQQRYDFHLEMLAGRRYASTLEIGCGSGGLTRRLATPPPILPSQEHFATSWP